jgi:uncharacterized protein YpmS
MEDLNLLSLNDEGEVITEMKEVTPWKKIAIILVALLLILIVIITIIILAINNSNKDNHNNNGDNPMDIDDESIPYDDNSYIGEILCTYDIYSYKVETPILSEDFIKTTNFDIYVNDRKIAYTKKYKFPKFGSI